MSIDKQKLQKLLWAEAASYRADCADWKRNTEALQEFLGEKTVEEVALELLGENVALIGPHDWLAQDLIKELVDNAQSFQENSGEEGENQFVTVLLAAAGHIRRQEMNTGKLKSEIEALRKALSIIRDQSSDLGACECAADALASSLKESRDD
ncbi:hypothetical protein [Pseudomonas sp. R62]|uniref:hypothetical protein n=1 Tax=Pseudomonas sp. R62 TaxID=1144884 RepID=UPI0002F2EFDB|nr:hypothetical protein [Pseudomonas sp. R62]